MLSGRRVKASNEIPTSSMADIAFLLLVFFLVTTSMNQDKGIGMTLPPKGEPLPIPKENIVNVLVNARGDIALKEGGRPLKLVTLTMLHDRLDRRIGQNPNLVLSVLGDRNARYGRFVDVLDEIKIVGDAHSWSKISIAQPYGRAK